MMKKFAYIGIVPLFSGLTMSFKQRFCSKKRIHQYSYSQNFGPFTMNPFAI